MTDATDLSHQVATAAAKIAPPVIVTLYGVVSKGLPLLVGFATLVYVLAQTAHLFWKWTGERDRQREIDQSMSGPVARYGERPPE